MSLVLLFLPVSSPSGRDANTHPRGQAGDINEVPAEGRLTAKRGPASFEGRQASADPAWGRHSPRVPCGQILIRRLFFFSPLKLAKEPWQMKQNLSMIPAGQGCGGGGGHLAASSLKPLAI